MVRRMIDRESAVPLWRQVADVIRGRVADGTYPAGKRLPPVKGLAAEHEVGESTVKKALAALKVDGVVDSAAGVAWYVPEGNGHAGPSAPVGDGPA